MILGLPFPHWRSRPLFDKQKALSMEIFFKWNVRSLSKKLLSTMIIYQLLKRHSLLYVKFSCVPPTNMFVLLSQVPVTTTLLLLRVVMLVVLLLRPRSVFLLGPHFVAGQLIFQKEDHSRRTLIFIHLLKLNSWEVICFVQLHVLNAQLILR